MKLLLMGAVRAKRGLRDTAQSGGYTKDVSYLRGELKPVANHMESGGNLEELYVGKSRNAEASS